MLFQETSTQTPTAALAVNDPPAKAEKKWVNIADRKHIDFGVLASKNGEPPTGNLRQAKIDDEREAAEFLDQEFDRFVKEAPVLRKLLSGEIRPDQQTKQE